MNAPKRLFGLPGAERLWSTIRAVLESERFGTARSRGTGDAESVDTEFGPVEKPWTIEEWSVRPPVDTVPEAVLILDWVQDWMGEEAEYVEAPFGGANLRDVPHAMALVNELRWLVAKQVTEFQADKLVATHEVEMVDGQLFVDGEPITETNKEK